jgi:hypothetical protein
LDPSVLSKIRVNRPLASGSESLWLGEILRVHIKVIIGPARQTAGRHGELGECLPPIGTYAPVGVLYDCFGFLGSSLGTGRSSRFDIPQAKMLEKGG